MPMDDAVYLLGTIGTYAIILVVGIRIHQANMAMHEKILDKLKKED